MGPIPNCAIPQLGQFPMWPIPDDANSRLRHSPIGAIPNVANFHMGPIGTIPNVADPQLRQFQLGQFPIEPIPKATNSQLRHFPTGTIPKATNSQLRHFPIGTIPNWDNSQCSQFPLGAIPHGPIPPGPGHFPVAPNSDCSRRFLSARTELGVPDLVSRVARILAGGMKFWQMAKLTWLVLGEDPAARSHRVEQFTAL